MFHKALAAQLETSAVEQPKLASLWGFRRRVTDPVVAPAAREESSFATDTVSTGFENFGRDGLQLGGLHRDQQWVGAWGGRC